MSKVFLSFLLMIPISLFPMNDQIAIVISEKPVREEYLRQLRREKKELIAQAASNIDVGFCSLLAGCFWLSKIFCLKPVAQPVQITESDCYILGCSAASCCIFCVHGCYSYCCKSKS